MAAKQISLPTTALELERGFENRILNAHKDSRGRQLTQSICGPIPIKTDSGGWWIVKIIRPFWHNPQYLAVEVLLKKKPNDPSEGLYAHLELQLRERKSYGTISFNYDRIRLSRETREYCQKFIMN